MRLVYFASSLQGAPAQERLTWEFCSALRRRRIDSHAQGGVLINRTNWLSWFNLGLYHGELMCRR